MSGFLPPVVMELRANAAQYMGEMAKASAAADAMARKTTGSAEATASGWQKMAGVGKVAAGATVAGLAVVAGVSLDMAAKFQKSTTLLQTAGGESAKNMALVRQGILDVAQSTGVSATQLTEGMYTVEKATYRGAAGLQVLKAAAQGATAEGVDMGVMTNALTSIMMSYHLGADKAVATTNELVAGAGAAKTTMQEYASSLSSVLPVASAAGVSFAEVGGAIATLTQHGTSADESTQELANTIRNLQAPNHVAVNAMNQLGLSATDISTKLGQRGLTGTIQLITDAISSKLGPAGLVILDTMKKSATGTADLQAMMAKMPPSLREASQAFLDGNMSLKDYMKAYKDMGAEGAAQGKQFSSLAQTVHGYNDQIKAGGPAAQTATAALKAVMGGATGMNTALMLGGENMKVFKEKTEEMTAAANRSGADISTNAQTQATLSQQLARTKAMLEAVSIEIGTKLIPVASSMLTGFVDLFHGIEQGNPVLLTLAGVAAALVGTLSTYYVVTKLVKAGQVLWEAGTVALTGAQWALAAATEATIWPITLTVAAVAALVGGFILAYNKIGWFHDGVNRFLGGVKDIAEGSIGWITGTALPALSHEWTQTVKAFTDAGGMFHDFFTNTVGMFTDFQHNTAKAVGDWKDHTIGMFSDFQKNTQGMFDDFFHTFGAGWKGYWKDPIGETANFVKVTNNAYEQWIRDTEKGFLGWSKDTEKGFADWNKDASKDLTSWMSDTQAGFKNWNKDTSKTLTDWATSTKGGFEGWNRDTSKGLTGWMADVKNGFSKWNTDTSKGLHVWVDTNTTTMADFQTHTQGMFDDFFARFGKGWAGYWKDPIGETVNFYTSTTASFTRWSRDTSKNFHNWFGSTSKGFHDWNTDASKNLDGWITDTEHGFQGWNKDASKTLTDWINSTRSGFQSWNKDASKTLTDWIGSSISGFTGWNKDTSKNLTDWIGLTKSDLRGWNLDTSKNQAQWSDTSKSNFSSWNQDTSKNFRGWFTGSKGGFLDWNRGVSGMIHDWGNNTQGMIRDWGNNTNGMFHDWDGNLTGTTRHFVDNTGGMLRDFNHNTIGMFRDFTSNTAGMFRDLGGHLSDAWSGIKYTAQGAANWIRGVVFDPLNNAIRYIGTTFSHTADFIGTAWDKIKQAAASPVSWIVNTVYENGIRPAWNAISDAVGLHLHLPDEHFASGGVAAGGGQGGINPGYRPGVDSIPAMTSPGEAWMVPEWTRAVGAHNVHAWNRAARQGGPAAVRKAMGFDDGGVAHFDNGGIAGWLGGVASGLWNTATGVFDGVGKFLSNPAGVIADAIGAPIRALEGSIPGGDFGRMMFQLPLDLVSSLTGIGKRGADAINAQASSFGGTGHSAPTPARLAAAVKSWVSAVNGQYMDFDGAFGAQCVDLASFYERDVLHGPNITGNGKDWFYAGAFNPGLRQVGPGAEAALGDIASWGPALGDGYGHVAIVLADLGNALEILSQNPGPAHIMNLSKFGLEGYLRPVTGYAGGGVVPVMDNETWVPPGLFIGNNKTGGPERLTNTTPGSGHGGAGNHITVNVTTNADPAKIASEMAYQLLLKG